MIKQVIIVRNDLGMRRGKSVAQGAHAALTAYLDYSYRKTSSEWFKTGQTKICLKANSEEQLISLYEKAKEANLACSLVIDEGRTEFKGVPTPTAVAIGPDEAEEVDKITGELELL